MKGLLSFFAVFALLLFSVSSVQASSYHGPRIKLKDGASTNWSGYAALTSLTNPQTLAVSDVKGTWTVPTLSCTGVSGTTYSSAWVGIDGYSNSTVEQLGTEHDCVNGQPSYSVWYEMYPKPSYRVNVAVKQGDVVTGEVKYINGSFVLSLQNATTGKGFTTTQKANKAQRQSAEWIVEAPWSGGVLPLANFGTLSFTASYANIFSKGLVPVGNLVNDKIDMVASDGTTVKATTSALVNGTDFSVTWNHN